MSLNLLLVLIVLAFAAALSGWKRCSRTLALLAVVVLLLVGCGPVPVWLLHRLQSQPVADTPVTWGQRNVIVLLGAGTVRPPANAALEPSLFAYGRIDKAAALYHACRRARSFCKVEVSGGDALGLGRSEAAVYAGVLQQLGVDAGDLLLESHSMNTWQNAQFSAPLLKRVDADTVVLVSSGFHLRRGVLYFSHFGIRATPVRADYVNGQFSWLPLSYNFSMTDLAMHEYTGIARYYVYNALGWNVKATRAGAL